MMPSSKNFDQIELITLYEVSKILGASLSLNKPLRQVLDVIASNLNMHRGMISLSESPGSLEPKASVGLSNEEMQRGTFKVGEGITGKIFKCGMPMVIPDIANEPLFLNKTGAYQHHKTKSIAFLGVPIKIGTECIGVLSFQFEKHENFKGFQSILRLLIMVARLIGQSVELYRKVSSERQELLQEKSRLKTSITEKHILNSIIGESKVMQAVFSDVKLAALGNNTILLRGESGTGKEVIARAIHLLSNRKDAPFIKVNCAALTESLVESELFGHEKGAFTGALNQRKGRFEQAQGGTLFLDEIGDISPAFQVKLLRVLQEREFERVGGNTTLKIDVRFVFATNRNLENDVRQGKFRADLYFRINVISIPLPPLRERREDIPLLTQNMLAKFNQENKVNIKISADAQQVLMDCHWPGNVRELQNCVTRFCTLSHSNLIQANYLPCQSGGCLSSTIWEQQATQSTVVSNNLKTAYTTTNNVGAIAPYHAVAAEDARTRIIHAMEKTGWVQAKAARSLNLTPRQMGYALKKYKIDIKKL